MSHVEPIDGIGRSDYERYCELLGLQADYNLTPRQRQAALPSWLSPELVATPMARENLSTFGRRHLAPQPSPTVTEVLSRIWALGDEEIALAIAEVLVDGRVPPPVRDYGIERVTWIGVGRLVAGFCASSNLSPSDGTPRPRLIVLTDHRPFDNLVIHELAHAWTVRECTHNAGAVWQSAVVHSSISRVPLERRESVIAVQREYGRMEDVADRLSGRWGYGPVFRGGNDEQPV
jgi:hypothetical protein